MDFNPQLPLSQAHTLPSFHYYDKDIFAKEKKIFRDNWQFIGRKSKLSGHGDFFTTVIADEPILVVQNDTIDAFSNVCRHRGTILCNSTHSVQKKFVCPYHGWTYSLKGDLLGCSEFEGVENFKKEDNGLRKFRVNTWGNFIFANMNNPDGLLPSSNEWSLPRQINDWLPESAKDYKFDSSRTYDVKCNWKVFVDNYLDGGYHINHAHKSLANITDYSEYTTHIYDKVIVQTVPLVASLVRAGEARYIWLYPNFMINYSDGAMDINHVIPVDENNCKVVFDFYFAHDKGGYFTEESVRLSDRIQQEDIEICERVQKGMKSDLYENGRFSVKREVGIYHFHKLIYKDLQ